MNAPLLAQCSSIEFLKRIPESSVKLAYVDPPWARESPERLAELYLHTAALCKACLKEDGVIVWHAVPEVVSETRAVLDKVFKRDFFETEFVLKRALSPQSTNSARPDHSTLIVYSKTGDYFYDPPTKAASESRSRRFNGEDADGRRYRLDSLITSIDRPTLNFEWKGERPREGNSWRYTQARLEELESDGRIAFSGKGPPRLKRYEDEAPLPPLGSVWDDIPLLTVERTATDAILGQQPIALAQRILTAFTEEGDRIVDPYCGSGTMPVVAQASRREWLAADNAEGAVELTLSRLGAESERVFSSRSSDEIDGLEIQHRLSDLLRAYQVDFDPHSADTHVLISRDESKHLEFKESLSLDVREQKKGKHIETSVLKTIVAFLNSDGGTLLVGVADDKKVPGIDAEVSLLFRGSNDVFLLHFKNLLHGRIGPEFYPSIDQRIVRLDEAEVLRVDVLPSSKPCFIGNDFYVRTNPATDKLEGPSLIEYVGRRFVHG